MLKRRLKLFGKILLGLFVLLFAFLLFERFRGQIALASYKRKLIARGEKLSPQDFVRHFSDKENGAPEVISAIERLRKGKVLPMNPPPRMKLTTSGRAVVGFREDVWIEKGTYRNDEWVNERVTNRWDQIAADLDANKTTLAEIRTALAKPVLNNRLDLSQAMKMKFLHLARAKSLTYWLGGGGQLALREGRNRDAMDDLIVEVRLPRLLAEDHIVISELVRIAIGAIAKADTWEALQAEGWTDENLALLQRAWESQEFGRAMARSLEGERIFAIASAADIRSSNDNTYNFIRTNEIFPAFDAEAGSQGIDWRWLSAHSEIAESLRKNIYCPVWRFAWSHQEERRYLGMLQVLLESARTAATDKSIAKVQATISKLNADQADIGFYDRIRFPQPGLIFSLSHAMTKAARMETDRSLTISAIALKRYSLRYGKLPTSLEALVPELLPAVPVDYMDGKPVRYHLNDDGSFTLYSIGEDGKDDGGDLSLPPDVKMTRDSWKRRDYVWPAPATQEEVEAYRKESSKN